MANLKSSQKKARKDVKITKRNNKYRNNLDKLTNLSKKGAIAADAVSKAYSQIDKAAKRKIISKQKAIRLKSKVAKSTAK